jgi:hypothetical protein
LEEFQETQYSNCRDCRKDVIFGNVEASLLKAWSAAGKGVLIIHDLANKEDTQHVG